MNILGINNGFHDASAALVKDGELVFAAAEERFTRIKQDSTFPYNAISTALRHADLDPRDVDIVAFGWPRHYRYIRHNLKMMWRRDTRPSVNQFVQLLSLGIDTVKTKAGTGTYGQCFDPPSRGFRFYDHHYCHALSAYCASGYTESAVLVIDGRGAYESTTLWHAAGNSVKLLKRYEYPNSLGLLYAEATELLGFARGSDEWKVMGLASFGEPTVDLSNFIHVGSNDYRVDGRKLLRGANGEESVFATVFSRFARGPNDEITQAQKDFAASIQHVCTQAMISLAQQAAELTKLRKLCLAGGVTLNCKANGELLQSGLFDSVFVQAAAGDDGCSIGAAFAAHLAYSDMPIKPQAHTYLGPAYSDEDVERQLKIWKVPYVSIDNPGHTAALLLADGKLIGWFQGRMEFGPRALGARSILADPRYEQNRDKVNAAVKFREMWRPFAPSVMHSDGEMFFKNYVHSPYMNISFWATDTAKSAIPAVVHVDGSCRVQSVIADHNPEYAELLNQMKHLTGSPVVLNTSFNLKGEPIVCSPQDAIRTFFTSGLDALVIGHFLVRKSW